MKNKRNKYTHITKLVILLILSNITFASSDTPKISCAAFDKIALQFAIAQNKMTSPITLDKINITLGPKTPSSTSSSTSYSWIHRKRILLVVVKGDKIANRMLTGKDDGSPTSRKMEQLYAKLKSATSIWTIKNVEKQLGKGYTSTNKSYNYNWHCGADSIKIITNKNNKILSATINYLSDQYALDKRLGTNHPEWDIENEYSGKFLRSWKRSFD